MNVKARPVGTALAVVAAVVVAASGLGACGGPRATTEPTAAATQPTSTAAPTPPAATASPAASASPLTGFAFDAESVVGYYRSQGYTCGESQPSAQAAGYTFTSCELTDAAGRSRVVGVVVDPGGELADGFASIRAAPGEDVLEPAAVLEPLGGFLGAMLGDVRGESLLPWLADHLGDAYGETSIDALRVATYTPTPEDHATLVVEVGNQAYLEAPKPSPSLR